jgi:hypothetical protein
MNSWLGSALRVGMFAAGAADTPLASDNDKPAAPNAGRALLLRFRLDGCFARDMADTSHTFGLFRPIDHHSNPRGLS